MWLGTRLWGPNGFCPRQLFVKMLTRIFNLVWKKKSWILNDKSRNIKSLSVRNSFCGYEVHIIFSDLFTVVRWLADRGHAWMVLNQIGGATIANHDQWLQKRRFWSMKLPNINFCENLKDWIFIYYKLVFFFSNQWYFLRNCRNGCSNSMGWFVASSAVISIQSSQNNWHVILFL